MRVAFGAKRERTNERTIQLATNKRVYANQREKPTILAGIEFAATRRVRRDERWRAERRKDGGREEKRGGGRSPAVRITNWSVRGDALVYGVACISREEGGPWRDRPHISAGSPPVVCYDKSE